jgi:hypothetical protein
MNAETQRRRDSMLEAKAITDQFIFLRTTHSLQQRPLRVSVSPW